MNFASARRAAFATFLFACAIPCFADATPVGPSFVVNSPSPGPTLDADARVAMSPDGRFGVVWNKGGQIVLRTFSAGGSPVSAEKAVAAVGSLKSYHPNVTWNPAGGFIVTWTEYLVDRGLIMAARFHANGNPKDQVPIVVSGTDPADIDSAPRVAARSDGAFVVVWDAQDALGGPRHVFGRGFDSLGLPLGAPFRLGSHGAVDQGAPDAAISADGGFLAVWLESTNENPYANIPAVYLRHLGIRGLNNDPARRIDNGNVFEWSSGSGGTGGGLSLAANARGDAVATWLTYSGNVARRFVGPGSPLESAPLRVGGDAVFYYQPKPEVGVDASGGFVSTWSDAYAHTYVRRFDRTGVAREPAPFEVSDVVYPVYQPGGLPVNDMTPDVATRADGAFVVVWWGRPSVIDPSSPVVVRARLYRAP